MRTERRIKRKVRLGRRLITATAREALSTIAVRCALARHASGDWGDLCEEDRQWNDQALRYGGALVSVYYDGSRKFYVVTEGDRSATTIHLATNS
jgi:hypothetical protein